MSQLYECLKTTAKQRGNAKALVYRDTYQSWRGLLYRVERRTQEFSAMGIGEGDWVGLMLGNVPDFIILSLALSKLGATVVPIDPTTGTRELELMMAAAPLRALVTRPRGSEGAIAANGSPSTPRDGTETETDPETPEMRRRLQGTLLTCSVFRRDKPDFGVDPVCVMFTADSMGDPKGVLRTRENIDALAENVITALNIDANSRVLTAVPLFHAYGWDVGLLPVLKTGATMFLEEEISARRVAKLLRDQNIDVLPGTPTMYAELSKLPTAKPLKVDNPRFLSSGSELDLAVADNFTGKFGVPLLSCYHSTEAGMISLDTAGKSPKTVGEAVEGVELKLYDTDGKQISNGKRGTVWLRGAAMSQKSIGPYEDMDAAKDKNGIRIGETDGEGWFRTGDVGKFDRGGRIVLAGREDDIVKVEGKRVALGEVESCLESFDKVKRAKATVVTDPMTGSMVVAKVVSAGKDCEAEEVIDHCARNLAPYKVPRRVEFCQSIAS